MHFDTRTLNREATNSNLLRILTKRKAQSITEAKRQWPGKLAPSFASNIKMKPNKQEKLANIKKNQNGQKEENMRKTQTTKSMDTKSMWRTTKNIRLIRDVPIAKMGSLSLSIQPSSRSKRLKHTPNHNFNSQKKLENIKIEDQFRHMNQENQSIMFGNNRVSTALSKNRKSREQEHLETMNIKKSIIEGLSSSSKSEPHYLIDFSSFNYIDKVIDNPEVWRKFVRKKIIVNGPSNRQQ